MMKLIGTIPIGGETTVTDVTGNVSCGNGKASLPTETLHAREDVAAEGVTVTPETPPRRPKVTQECRRNHRQDDHIDGSSHRSIRHTSVRRGLMLGRRRL